MRRLLLLVMVGIVAGALLLAGAGTYLIAGSGERSNDATVVLRQARKVAAEVPVVLAVKTGKVRRGVLSVLRETDGLRFVVVEPGGGVRGSLPASVPLEDLQAGRLRAGHSVSGTVGDVAYGAVPVSGVTRAQVPGLGVDGVLVAVLVQPLPPSRLGLTYLLLVSGGALAIAAVVALLVSRRISRPLVAAVTTTRRIAEGDLAARVPDGPGAYPELSSLTASINSMAVSLAHARTTERQFLLSVSHDLRTPLTSILGYSEAISDGTVRDPQIAAGVITTEARRLERLVRDLLELARLESSQWSLHLVEADVGELTRSTSEGFRPTIHDAGLSLDMLIPAAGTLHSIVDPDRLAQVVRNLVENAYKHAAARVQVWAGLDGADVVILVDDDGAGIPVGEQTKVWNRLYQATGRTAARQAGSGLGLAIVAELVTAMGGSVAAISPTTAGGGTRMEVRLRASNGLFNPARTAPLEADHIDTSPRAVTGAP